MPEKISVTIHGTPPAGSGQKRGIEADIVQKHVFGIQTQYDQKIPENFFDLVHESVVDFPIRVYNSRRMIGAVKILVRKRTKQPIVLYIIE